MKYEVSILKTKINTKIDIQNHQLFKAYLLNYKKFT